jgi:hypothetical protein
VNWAYAKQFHNGVMLSSAESAAPWLTNVFPFMASAFPLLGIVYTMMAETITETAAEEKKGKPVQISALSELAKQTQLPVATLRRALASGSRLSSTEVTTQRPTSELTPEAIDQKSEENRPITGHFVTLETSGRDASADTGKNSVTTTGLTSAIGDKNGNPDKLQMTIEALKDNPNMTDEALADLLSLKRPASARFWRLKAIEILSASDQTILDKTSTTSVLKENSWRSNGELANGAGPKR